MGLKMRRRWLGVCASIFLGITFVIAGGGKIFAQSGNIEPLLLPEFLPESLAQAISTSLPYVEFTVGVLLILGIAVRLITSLSALMVAGFVASNIMLINLGLAAEPCGCFGGVLGGGVSVNISLILDVVMVAMVSIIFVYHPSRFSSIRPWCLTVDEKPIGNISTLKGGLSDEQSS